jgi:DNA-binding winged helix-turn-helix (wHTH) protein/tetratricopeptide (TPR) repeat protein/cytochrome oxidase Cu insertion factor (SCO1/SenC/PrrC family)
VSNLELLHFGDLAINPRSRTVQLLGEPVETTRREFDILTTLAAHPGWVYSVEALATADPAFYGSPASVNVHVARLRKKLALAGCVGLIDTVRGVGYRLNPDVSIQATDKMDAFVGRTRELEVLESALTQALASRECRFVSITGETGVGKSCVAEQFARTAAGRGFEVWWGRPIETGAPPYWSWVEMLRELLAADGVFGDEASAAGLAALAQVQPQSHVSAVDAAATEPPLPPQEATFLLHDSVTRAFARASEDHPILLVFDDLQWACPETLALLEYVIQHLAQSRVMIVGLCRDEPGSSPALDRALADCADRRQTSCLELRGFSVSEVEQLARAFAVAGVDARAAEVIHQRTGGNPFFVSELLKMISNEYGDAEILPSSLSALVPTPNIRNLVRGRLARLTPQTVRFLEAASVLGLEFSLPLLKELCASEKADILEALGVAIDAGALIASETPEELRFRHAIVHQVVYLQIPAAARIRLHGRAGDLLAEKGGSSTSLLVDIARHYREAVPAGYVEKAMEYALRAGHSALQSLAFESAVKQLQFARNLLAAEVTVAWPAGLLAQTEEELGDALAALPCLRDAIDAYRAAVSHLPAMANLEHGRLLGKLGRLLTETREWGDAHEAFDQAASILANVAEPDRADAWRRARVQAEVARMWLLYYELDLDGMAQWIARVGDEIEQIANPTELADSLVAVLMWSILRDHYWPTDETVAVARRAHDAASISGSRSRLALATTLLGYVLLWNGRLEEARQRLDDGLIKSERVGDHTSAMIALAALSCLDRIEGDGKAARASAMRCEARAVDLGSRREFGAMGAANLAWAAWRDGDHQGAQEHAARAFEGWSPVPMYPFKWTAAWPMMAIALSQGNEETALENARMLMEPGAQPPRGEIAAVVAGALSAAEHGDSGGALAELRRAVELGLDFSYT